MATLTAYIAANTDDGGESSSTWYTTGWSSGIGVGNDSVNIREYSAFTFTVPSIASGDTINSAYIRAYSKTYTFGDSFTADVYCDDVDDSSPCSSSSLASSRTATTATVSIDETTYSTTFSWQDLYITSCVQEVVNRAGWAAGQKITVIFKVLTYGSYAYVYLRDYDYSAGSFPAELHIDYTAGGGGGVTPIPSRLANIGRQFATIMAHRLGGVLE